MKNKKMFLSSLMMFFVAPLAFAYCKSSTQPAEAITKWVSNVNSKGLSIDFAYQAKDNVELDSVTDAYNHYSFGWRHGSIDEMKKFDKFVSDGASSSQLLVLKDGAEDKTGAEVRNWVIYTGNNDAVILFFTAIENCYFTAHGFNSSAGAPQNATVAFHLKRSGTTTITNIQSNVIGSKGADCVAKSALEKTHLNAGDTIYWSFSYSGTDWRRNIQSSVDNNNMPYFTIEEDIVVPSENIDGTSLINNISQAVGGIATSTNELIKYTTRAGTIYNPLYNDLETGYLGSASDNPYLSASGLVIKNGAFLTYEIIAQEDTALTMSFGICNDNSINGLTITGYKYTSSVGKTQQIYKTVCTSVFDYSVTNGTVALKTGDKLYIEFAATEQGEHNFRSLLSLAVSQTIDNEKYLDFPKYDATDYSNRDEFTFKEIVLETARIRGEKIVAKDFEIQALSGKVSGTSIQTKEFDYFHYNSGVYVDSPAEDATGSIYAAYEEFNSVGGAAMEENRMSFSKANYAIFAIKALENTKLKVRHPATSAGWINGTSIYVWTIQAINGKPHLIEEKNIPNNTQEENAFAADFNLKKGDVAYYAIGTKEALNANYNITPTFKSVASEYDENARNNQFLDFTSTNKMLHDVVTDTVANNYEPNSYGLLDIYLAHGSIQQMEPFDNKDGDGTGGSTDSVISGSDAQNRARFWRWQMRCGQNDDAIVKITAKRDTHLEIIWRRDGEITSWATHTALRHYAFDTDGFAMFLDAKYATNDGHAPIDDTYYNDDVHLLAGQSFVIDYTSLGGSYGVIQYDFNIKAVASEFDSTKVFDFTEAKEAAHYKESLIAQLEAYIDRLNEDDYSLVNWAYIEEAYNDFVTNSANIVDKDQLDALFEQAKQKIDSILTREQEDAELNRAKQEAKQEALAYLNANKDKLKDEDKAKAEELYSNFCSAVDAASKITAINVQLVRFKASIDNLVKENGQQPSGGENNNNDDGGENKKVKRGCRSSIIATSAIISITSLLGASLLIKKKKEK